MTLLGFCLSCCLQSLYQKALQNYREQKHWLQEALELDSEHGPAWCALGCWRGGEVGGRLYSEAECKDKGRAICEERLEKAQHDKWAWIGLCSTSAAAAHATTGARRAEVGGMHYSGDQCDPHDPQNTHIPEVVKRDCPAHVSAYTVWYSEQPDAMGTESDCCTIL